MSCSIQLNHKLPCMFLDFWYCRFSYDLPRQVRLRICGDDSKISEESLKKSLLEVIMIIRVICKCEADKFNEFPKGMPIFC